jgi:PPOX class probable F420-dependent enzyme
MSTADEISSSRYVSLVTYRKDGTEVATPVWQVPQNGELLIVTEAESWKVKRIRNNSQVKVIVCSLRGKIEPDAPTGPGTARLLDEAGTAAARDLLARRYMLSRLGNATAKLLRLKRPPMIGIAITLN